MSKKMIKYHRKCGDFSICCELGEEGVIHLEPSDERRTLFQKIVRGSGWMAASTCPILLGIAGHSPLSRDTLTSESMTCQVPLPDLVDILC